jgi:hypothetical protein
MFDKLRALPNRSMSSINPYASPQVDQHGSQPRAIPTAVGEILSAGTTLYVNHFWTWVAMVVVVWGPLELAGSYLEYFVIDAEDVGRTFQMNALFEGIFGIVVAGGVIQMGSDAWRGEPISWTRGLAQGLAAWPRLFTTRLVGGIVLILGIVLFIVPGLYVAVRIALADAVSVLERKSGMAALPRSMELTYRKFFRYLALSFVTYGPLIVLSAVHQMPLVMFPEINHWIVAAALTLTIDLATPWIILVFVAAYLSETAEEPFSIPSKAMKEVDVASAAANA